MKRNKKLYIILSLIIIVVMMTIGYAAYNQKLNISETSKIDSNFNILITNIEIKEVGGQAINNNDPIYNGLEASFDITFNKKHDYIEYNVEVSNKGTIEAYLNQIKIENEKSKVVSMSYRGINVGDKLSLGESKTFVVRVEYLGGISKGEIDLSLDYSAEENPSGEIILPEANYKVIYNTEENGGEKAEIEEKNYNKEESIDLSNKGKKEGYTFVGWNTNKDSKEAIKELTMGEEDITLYAIYKKAIEVRYKIGDGISEIPKEKDTCEIYNKEEECSIELPSIENIKAKDGRVIDGWYKGTEKINNNTQKVRENSIYEIKAYTDTPAEVEINTSTLSNRIRVVTNITNDIEIEKYEYKIDNGEYIESNNTYSFDNLEHNTQHVIKIRVTTIGHAVTEKEITVRTLEIETPTFTEETEGIVKISYPEECNGTYTCTYIKDGGEEVSITKNPEEVIFGASGTLIAKVTDGTNYITSSTYTVERTNLYVSNSGNDTNGYGTKEAPYLTLNQAYDCASLTQESTIYVMNDITVNETTNLDENKTITLTSYSEDDSVNSLIRGSQLQSGIIYQTSGNVTTRKIVFNGNNVEARSALLVLNDDNAFLNINDGTVIEKGNNILVYADETTQKPETLGGGICANKGTLTLKNASILNNSSDYGGGIYANLSPIVLLNSVISHNTSKSNGGGITANSNAEIKSTEVSYNTTNGGGGGLHAIGNVVNLVSVEFTNNTALNSHGGAILSRKHLNITENSIINNNKTGKTGGGIYFTCGSGECPGLYVTDTAITNNSATNGGGVDVSASFMEINSSNISNNTADEYAGGLHITNMKEATLENVVVSGNKASYGGGINTSSAVKGLLLTINNSQIINNTATGNAGGLRIDRVSVTANGVTISGNKAPNYAGVTCRGASELPVQFIFNGNTIRNNIATGSSGGIFITDYCTYTRKSGTVCGNTPTNSYETSTTCPS